MRPSFVVLLPFAVAGCGDDVPATVRGADPLERELAPTETSLRAACAEELDEIQPSHDFGASTERADATLPSHAVGVERCTDYSWARGFISVAALVEPRWAGPALTASAWDCSHSALEYGVYRRAGARWYYAGGALAFGALEDGECRYSVEHFPQQPGSDKAVVLAFEGDEPTEVRVGARGWSHNDPAMGHSGADCATASCYWPVVVAWHAY